MENKEFSKNGNVCRGRKRSDWRRVKKKNHPEEYAEVLKRERENKKNRLSVMRVEEPDRYQEYLKKNRQYVRKPHKKNNQLTVGAINTKQPQEKDTIEAKPVLHLNEMPKGYSKYELTPLDELNLWKTLKAPNPNFDEWFKTEQQASPQIQNQQLSNEKIQLQGLTENRTQQNQNTSRTLNENVAEPSKKRSFDSSKDELTVVDRSIKRVKTPLSSKFIERANRNIDKSKDKIVLPELNF